MTQIKNVKEDLWQGFHAIERSSGETEYAPNENIEPYEIWNKINNEQEFV